MLLVAAQREPMQSEASIMKIHTEKEAAGMLRISPRTLQRWRSVGGGPEYIRLGERRLSYPDDGLQAFSAARTYTSRAAELAKSAA